MFPFFASSKSDNADCSCCLLLSIQYWRNPGALAPAGLEPKHIGLDRFLGMLSVIVQAAFSFQGMELVAVCVSLPCDRTAIFTLLVVPRQKRKAHAATLRRLFAECSTVSLSSMCVSVLRLGIDVLLTHS